MGFCNLDTGTDGQSVTSMILDVLAVVRQSQKNFRPAAHPLPEGAGWPKFNQLKMVTTFTYKPSLVRIDAYNFELSW